ncbi:hypothetical protein BC829DRAFT_124826 [Chytridium lagenaria]|nr:hypothetical protein BC829DRAFT_124826 [Chytridium lagenaria]
MEHAERRAKIMARGSSNPTLPTSNKRNDDGFPFEDHPSVRSIGARINRLFGYVKRHPKAFVIAFIVLLYMFGGPFFIWFLGYRKHSGSTGGVGHGVLKASDVVKSPVNVVQQFMASAIQKGVDEVETIKKRLKTTEEQLAFERGKVAELQKKIESTAKEPLVGGDKVALVAILTSPDRFQRRATIRATAFQLLPPGIDVFFVMAAANESTTAALVAMEKKAYGDVIVLDGVGEDAKTVGLMELAADKVKSPFKAKYRFLVKGDDNAFLHFVNLKARLAGVEGDRIYFGRPTSTLNSMHDSAYALSWPIVEDLATHQITSSAQTDALIPLWLTSPDISHVKLYEKEVSEIYIDPVQHIPPHPTPRPPRHLFQRQPSPPAPLPSLTCPMTHA